MKNILIICLFISLFACSTPQEHAEDNCETVTLDGCQYYSCRGYYGYRTLTHKGNCTNPIHKCN